MRNQFLDNFKREPWLPFFCPNFPIALAILQGLPKLGMRFVFLFILLVACKPNYNVDPSQVEKDLRAQASQYPETKIQGETRLGNFEITLNEETPLHRINFVRLVKMGYFTDRYFYRNVYEIGMQGGGEFRDRLAYLVPAEYPDHLKPERGTIAMARYDEGNPKKSSSPTEFFIITNTEQAARFYKQYVVFGKVTKGLAVIDSMQKQRSFDEKPVIPVKFNLTL
jgi:cyclophilin family peptidyl-prolyl cis-trans isomerase